MAKCVICGKSSLFLSVNSSGQCKDCSAQGKPQNGNRLILSKEDKLFLDTVAVGMWSGSPPPPQDVNTLTSNELQGKAGYAITAKKYELAEKLLTLAEKKSNNPIDLHFCYNHLIELMYKRRDEIEHINANGIACSNYEYINRCVDYCMKDIQMLPKLFKTWEIKYDNPMYPVNIPAITRLAIINEKRGNIEEAIKLCEIAISYGLWDSKKMGFEGRLEKLKAKLQKNQK